MTRGLRTLTGGQCSPATGVVSGFVLKLARQSTALTQETLAEVLNVDVTTVQGWESGRRPLAAMNAGDFLRLCGRLSRLGAPPSTGRHLREAIEADQVLSTGITAGAAWVDADTHPLAASVHRWTTTNLITWPITGKAPQHLHEFTSKMIRRGPAPSCPSLGADERARFLDHLLTIAERGTHVGEALLRRQAVYLLGFDGRPQVVDWLRVEWKRAGGRPIKQGDITGLLEARSASVALASAGDGSHLQDFVNHMTDTRAEVANLNYWAHWIGELNDDQTTDAFMLDNDTRSWTGVRLLRHLANRLEPGSPHLPLNVHTLHALIASRPSLLNGRADVRASLTDAFAKLVSAHGLTRTGRDQVAGLQYALRIADR
jgi:transcriptional regulator with XRE-family HTH domain